MLIVRNNKWKNIISIPVFTGILLLGSFGLRNINSNKNINNLIPNSSNSETISNLALASNKEKIDKISSGSYHSSALTTAGNVYTWGQNKFGQLGDGETVKRTLPINIRDKFNLSADEKITQLEMGGTHSSALTDKGNVYTWGLNNYGQLGNNTTDNEKTPINITTFFSLVDPDEKITQLSMGATHSTALTNKGNVYIWGNNNDAQLGDGTNVDRHTPTKITDNFKLPSTEYVEELNLGTFHSSALTNKGNVFTWGSNIDGELGNGTKENSDLPVKITDEFNLPTDEKLKQIELGLHHSSALTDKGNVYTWGNNEYGQLGNDKTNHTTAPINITTFFGLVGPDEEITQLSMSVESSFALTKKGKVFSWGRNNYGQLGNNSKLDDTRPRNITDFFSLVDPAKEKIEQLSMFGYHSMAVTDNGGLFTWGLNNYGQLGIEGSAIIPQLLKISFPSTISFDSVVDRADKSVKINFTVHLNDGAGNVVVKDESGNEKAKSLNVDDGPGSILIKNLDPDTTYSKWTIEVDGNAGKIIPDFKTKITSSITYDSVTEKTDNSVLINFTVTKNDGAGNVVVKDESGGEKATLLNVDDGPGSILIENLDPGTTYTGWKIQVDGNPEVEIPSFKTTEKSIITNLSKAKNINTTSADISFNLQVNDGKGLVKIFDTNSKKVYWVKRLTSGDQTIPLTGLRSNTEYNLSVSVDDGPEKTIDSFTTEKHTLDDIEKDVKIEIKNKVKKSSKKITFTYSQAEFDGKISHKIIYKDKKTETVSPYDKYSYATGTVTKTYNLKQSIGNIENIETVYKTDGYNVILNSYTGSTDKLFGNSIVTKSGLSIPVIIGIALVTLTGIIIIFMVYYFSKNNKK